MLLQHPGGEEVLLEQAGVFNLIILLTESVCMGGFSVYKTAVK